MARQIFSWARPLTLRVLLIANASMLGVGCGSDSAPGPSGQQDERTGTVQEAIAFGDLAPDQNNVVLIKYLRTDGVTGGCSATFVSPVQVLTAAHCVNDARDFNTLFGLFAIAGTGLFPGSTYTINFG